MIATHFQFPHRFFPGQVERFANTADNCLLFAEVSGDKGLRNAVRFYWNAKGVTYEATASVSLLKIAEVTTSEGPPITYANWSYVHVKDGMQVIGDDEYAGKLYCGETATAEWQPARRAVRMLNYYSGSGEETVRADRTKPFMVIPPWQGFDASYSGNNESEAHPGYYIGWLLDVSLTCNQIVYDVALDRYALDCDFTLSAGAYSPVDYTGDGPAGQFEAMAGTSWYRVGRTISPDENFMPTLTLPDIFDAAYLNRWDPGAPYTGDCVSGEASIELGITYWQYTEPPPE